MSWFNKLDTRRKITICFFLSTLIGSLVVVAGISNIVNQLKLAGEETEVIKTVINTANSIMIIMITVNVISSSIIGFFLSKNIGKFLSGVSTQLQSLANFDFTKELPETFSNRKDEFGIVMNSFKKMTDKLNEVMTSINLSSDQVLIGANQLSNSSMALSQGATEQASSIEELTASMEEIFSQTKLNADNAKNAKEYAKEAKNNASTGSIQMKKMLQAMSDINESSNNISKIIKVIDDIAFQTNILALNAAVEAARAGQHGKGFAVVAEEVRNLAARSANAAKETTEMIEGSINKVEDGSKIANATADALNKIVDGVSKVADLVGNIANASSEQAVGVEQVNLGIAQIANVVQTTSATSEETAAASEELSGQASLLKEHASIFKLKKHKKESLKSANNELVDINPNVLKMLDNMNNQSPKNINLSDDDFGKY
ncbi:methyl-accepting chemotaxis protein [Clostridium grantii]|uniref:Methyl-accepting chemotaxis protein n=1 Tax=Clostridium grantii DSM 8605 TaxID=1121316 RepID=A0A1M5XAH4_9CLOT|nr:methyl-accepting chemotaxis protein [Clostridium grantii DSM 8605]